MDAWPEAGLRAEQITLEQFAEMFRRLALRLYSAAAVTGAACRCPR